jgi:hypothetical protein
MAVLVHKELLAVAAEAEAAEQGLAQENLIQVKERFLIMVGQAEQAE